MGIYDYEVTAVDGTKVSLESYRGKVLLIVNTATKCGYTPQYEGLEALYQAYQKQGFEILDFPCNQFGHQAPGTNEELVSFCQLKFHTTFQTFAKIEVNGDGAEPLYQYLKDQEPGDIKWNFTKFLVDQTGNVVARYGSAKKPKNIAPDIEKLLS